MIAAWNAVSPSCSSHCRTIRPPGRLELAAQGRAHALGGVPGLDADQAVDARAAQADLERDVHAGLDVGRHRAPVAARAEHGEVVGVLAEVVEVELHGPRGHDRAVDAEAVL